MPQVSDVYDKVKASLTYLRGLAEVSNDSLYIYSLPPPVPPVPFLFFFFFFPGRRTLESVGNSYYTYGIKVMNIVVHCQDTHIYTHN